MAKNWPAAVYERKKNLSRNLQFQSDRLIEIKYRNRVTNAAERKTRIGAKKYRKRFLSLRKNVRLVAFPRCIGVADCINALFIAPLPLCRFTISRTLWKQANIYCKASLCIYKFHAVCSVWSESACKRLKLALLKLEFWYANCWLAVRFQRAIGPSSSLI